MSRVPGSISRLSRARLGRSVYSCIRQGGEGWLVGHAASGVSPWRASSQRGVTSRLGRAAIHAGLNGHNRALHKHRKTKTASTPLAPSSTPPQACRLCLPSQAEWPTDCHHSPHSPLAPNGTPRQAHGCAPLPQAAPCRRAWAQTQRAQAPCRFRAQCWWWWWWWRRWARQICRRPSPPPPAAPERRPRRHRLWRAQGWGRCLGRLEGTDPPAPAAGWMRAKGVIR